MVTACTTSSRAIAGALFSAINDAAFNNRLENYLPKYIVKAALAAELPTASLPEFIQALSEGDTAALAKVPGGTPTVVAEGAHALQQAFADPLWVVFIIAVAFGMVALYRLLASWRFERDDE